MKKFIVEIDIDGMAFTPMPEYEVARILNTVAKKLDANDFNPKFSHDFYLFDCYGNRCGIAKLKKEEQNGSNNTNLS